MYLDPNQLYRLRFLMQSQVWKPKLQFRFKILSRILGLDPHWGWVRVGLGIIIQAGGQGLYPKVV